MNKEIKTILSGLCLDKVKRFEEIMTKENVSATTKVNTFWARDANSVAMSFTVYVYGIDNKTKFNANFHGEDKTYQGLIDKFLEWWDREIVRFNTYNTLSQSNKKDL